MIVVAFQGFSYPGQPPHLWKYDGINLTQEECVNHAPARQHQSPSLQIYTSEDGRTQTVVQSV